MENSESRMKYCYKERTSYSNDNYKNKNIKRDLGEAEGHDELFL